MSLTGIASSVLSALNGFRTNNQSSNQSTSNSISSEFQQLGQALQSGNLSQAQQDFATLTQNLPSATQTGAANTTSSTTAAASTNPLTQAITQLGNDLQSGNLSAAQSDFTTLQQDLQQQSGGQSGQIRGHGHHHHRAESSQASSSSSQTSQTNSIAQEFSQLAQSLQGGNLQGAQNAFATLQSDLQQIGGFSPAASSGASTPSATGSVNVTV